MRSACLFLIFLIATDTWAGQLFVPVDETGKPVQQPADRPDVAPQDTAGVVAEDPSARLIRSALEAEYRLAVEGATQVYVGCLESESRRVLGKDFDHCAATRERLRSLYGADLSDVTLGCVETAVLGKALVAAEHCQMASLVLPDTSNTERWR